MNKFIRYGLGVYCFVQANLCHAAEKFDILPDLPAPIMQAADASTVSTPDVDLGLSSQSVGHELGIIRLILALIFAILLIYLVAIIYTKFVKMNSEFFKRKQDELIKSTVSVLSTTQIGNNNSLHVVELDGKRMLIGASSNTIQLIKDLGAYNADGAANEEFSSIEIPNIKIPKIEIPKIEIPSLDFSKLLTKAHGKIEFTDSETSENITNNNDFSDNNSDAVIDSLFAGSANDISISAKQEPVKNEHSVDPDEYVLYKKYLS